MKKLSSIYFLVFISILAVAQVEIGQWQEHLPYHNGQYVAVSDEYVYCATELGLFSYSKKDKSIEKMNTITGLSDIEISALNFNPYNNILLIGYTNGNIDMIREKTITNISDIKRKQITGVKSINNIYFMENTAYLSCGFGIVKLDTDNGNITDTYIIGNNASYLNISELIYSEHYNRLFAATENGIYSADFDNPNLIDFQNWTKHTELDYPNASYSTLTAFDDKVLVNYDRSAQNADTIFQYDGNTWEYLDTTINNARKLFYAQDYIIVVKEYSIDYLNKSGELVNRIYTYDFATPLPNDAFLDGEVMWIADRRNGLIRAKNIWVVSQILPNGPANASVVDLAVENEVVWAAGGSRNNPWSHIGAYAYINGVWESFNRNIIPEMDAIHNISKIVINPGNSDHIFGGSWGYGVIEMLNGEVVQVYDESNTILENIDPYTHAYIRISDLNFDRYGNLWLAASLSPQPIYVKASDGTWTNFSFGNQISAQRTDDFIITRDDTKWVILENYGLFAFNINNTIDDLSDDEYSKFRLKDDIGEILSTNIFSLAEDRDGVIWVGTDKGVVAYYNPQNVFSGDYFYAQKIIVELEDNNYQYLLGNESVNAIAIDGANRKWFGTTNGVYLMSDDVQEEILRFNTDNSPLLSNNIITIGIDHVSGDVYFGTDKGLIAYKATATGGAEFYDKILVYPNPVKKDYEGLIAIKGLVTDADVKITDVSGQLVYQTIADGGQATWNGKDFSGNKVNTGVYLVFCTNEDGSKTTTAKILVIN